MSLPFSGSIFTLFTIPGDLQKLRTVLCNVVTCAVTSSSLSPNTCLCFLFPSLHFFSKWQTFIRVLKELVAKLRKVNRLVKSTSGLMMIIISLMVIAIVVMIIMIIIIFVIWRWPYCWEYFHCASVRMFSQWLRFLCKHVVHILISTLMELKVTLSRSLIQLRPLDEGSVFSWTSMQLRGVFLLKI